MQTRSDAPKPERNARAMMTSAALGLVALALVACGSSSDGGATASAGKKTTAPTQSADAYVAQAQKITQQAKTGVVYSPTNEYAPLDQLKIMTSWLGPTQSPPAPAGKRIAVVSCGATPCNEAAQAGARAARQVGLTPSLVNVNGSGDVQNLNEAMSSALAMHPSAIVTVCMAATQVAPKLEQARKAGIVTVSVCDPTPTGGNGQYDAAADYPNGLSTELLGWGIVANTAGKANVVAILDKGYPAVIRKIGNLVRVVKGCATCKAKTVTWQITDAVDSGKAANILSGVINANPQMDTLVLPYSVGMPSAVQAVASSGRDIKIYADDADNVNLQLLRDGSLTMISAVDPELVMHQALDQVIRGLDKTPYVEPAKLPYLAHLYTKDDVPKAGPGAFMKYFDYRTVYADLWKKQ
jgi:ABC-type sugar transport system substrate-binding protein